MPRNSVAYDEDFFAWTQEQARLLRAGDTVDVDVENLAEEIESVGRSDRREIRNRLTVLLTHLLKWQFQPRRRGNSWSLTIWEQRLQIESILKDSPSLQPFFAEIVPDYYRRAREKAARETRMGLRNFPAQCPYTPEQILSEDFLPE
jgi:hypothetical protein